MDSWRFLKVVEMSRKIISRNITLISGVIFRVVFRSCDFCWCLKSFIFWSVRVWYLGCR